MELKEIESAIEGVLFAAGEPVGVDIEHIRLPGQGHQHRADGVAQIEVDLREIREVGLAQRGEPDRRKLPPAVLLPQGMA